MRIYKTKEFGRLARKAGVSDEGLIEAVERAERGLKDGEIGKFLIKQRIAGTDNRGSATGYRAILFFKSRETSVFLHLFAKSGKGNLTGPEEDAYRDAAKIIAKLSEETISALVAGSKWIEIEHESHEDVSERSAPVASQGDEGRSKRRRHR